MLNLDDAGCLARIPADRIAAALAQLPKPEDFAKRIAAATVLVPDLGQVRVTCILRRDRLKRRYWSALRADREV
jgi:hypothetical protein